MIFIRISSHNEKVIEQVACLLLEEQLVIDVNIKRSIDRACLIDGKISFSKIYLLTAKTKGLLFPTIDGLIKKTFINESFEIYSLPIVHMDWEEAKRLTEEIKQI